ncbi:MAG: aminotransferase class V-fold PLP-dependent enzyme [Candidatus Kapaibacterium sp.]|nr:aminotransferase class V-fold PLP-dependent enzyme [Ignavibacteriota bacterium]MCB9220578.1 aminotransferase class V-fold PLP-dependent enzyme [Ignavibacteria bacterium]
MNLEEIEKLISEYEVKGKELEPNRETRNMMMESVSEYSEQFLDAVHNKKAFINDFANDGSFDNFPFEETPTSTNKVINFLKDNVDNAGINPASGGHIGYIPGGGIYSAALGDYLAAVMNRYAGVFYASPGAVRIENQIIDWVGELVGYKKRFGGNLASGGSMANLIAISTARIAKKIKSKDIENCTIYLTKQAHHCVTKALKIIGLHEIQLRYIPMDRKYRMIPEKVEEQLAKDKANGITPFMLVASAGTTDVGAIDPLNELADLAEKYGLWYHIDGAYGGFFLLCDETKDKLKGINRADSVILDPHKGMFLPYGVGIVLVKNVKHLLEANSYDANYMQDTKDYQQEYSPADLSPELSRHFRGLRMWVPMKLHGIAPFRACLSEKIWLTRYFYEKVQALGFEVGPEPDLTVAAFRYVPKSGDANKLNKKLLSIIHNDGRVFISSTTLDGDFWMRIAVLSFRTHKYHLDIILELLEEGIGDRSN